MGQMNFPLLLLGANREALSAAQIHHCSAEETIKNKTLYQSKPKINYFQ